MAKLTARSLGFAIGVVTFIGTHAVEVAMWSVWFGGAHDPWFLNSGRAMAFTLAWLFTVSVAAGLCGVPGTAVAAGAAVALMVVLALTGGSTLFPIVVSAGGLLVAGVSLLGAWIGSEAGRRLFSQR